MQCSRCDQQATIKQGNQHLCDMHYRFGQMRATAKRNGKAVPSHQKLHEMVPAGMSCPDCGVKMNWRAKDGKSTVATLQHYRSGELGIVCLSCNVRHAFMDGDSYRQMQKDHKKCSCCDDIKPMSFFSTDNGRSGVIRLKSICKTCSDKKVNQWRKENRDAYNRYQREYRAKQKNQPTD